MQTTRNGDRNRVWRTRPTTGAHDRPSDAVLFAAGRSSRQAGVRAFTCARTGSAAAGSRGYQTPLDLRSDFFFFGGVRLPFAKFNRQPNINPYGSAVLGTLQQVAAAIGTAVVVTILSVQSASLAASGADPVSALSGGVQLGMVFAAVTGVAVLVLAFFVPGRESAGQGHGRVPVLDQAAGERVA